MPTGTMMPRVDRLGCMPMAVNKAAAESMKKSQYLKKPRMPRLVARLSPRKSLRRAGVDAAWIIQNHYGRADGATYSGTVGEFF